MNFSQKQHIATSRAGNVSVIDKDLLHTARFRRARSFQEQTACAPQSAPIPLPFITDLAPYLARKNAPKTR
ncbi:MAG: hypothetical protein Q4D19_05615 [Lautropia sp.]|nr:hypothetical protein [Lautropia sp.]